MFRIKRKSFTVSRLLVTAASLCALFGKTANATPSGLPSNVFPAPWGVSGLRQQNFTTPSSPTTSTGEFAAVGKGSGFVRYEIDWQRTEPTSGTYDFQNDNLVIDDIFAAGLQPVILLDYGNSNHTNNSQVPPRTTAELLAYKNWVTAVINAVEVNYPTTLSPRPSTQTNKIIWEVYNEPDNPIYWRDWISGQATPNVSPDPDEYAAVVDTAVTALTAVDPNATIMMGSVGASDYFYTDELLKKMSASYSTSLSNVSAFSVHGYRIGGPESIEKDYVRLQTLLARYSPSHKLAIISGEWGYNTVNGGIAGTTGATLADRETQQAQYLVRQRLFNASRNIAGSVWYDWKNAGNDATNADQNYGTVTPSFFVSEDFEGETIGSTTHAGTWSGVAAGGASVALLAKYASVDSVNHKKVAGLSVSFPASTAAGAGGGTAGTGGTPLPLTSLTGASVGLYISCDETSNYNDTMTTRFVDQSGQVFEVILGNLNWYNDTSWHWVTASLSSPTYKYGGSGSGIPVFPIYWINPITVWNSGGSSHNYNLEFDDLMVLTGSTTSPSWTSKPADTAAQTMVTNLSGYHFVHSLPLTDGLDTTVDGVPNEYAMLMRNDTTSNWALAFWATDTNTGHSFSIPLIHGGTTNDTVVDALTGSTTTVTEGTNLSLGSTPQTPRYVLLGNVTSLEESNWSWMSPLDPFLGASTVGSATFSIKNPQASIKNYTITTSIDGQAGSTVTSISGVAAGATGTATISVPLATRPTEALLHVSVQESSTGHPAFNTVLPFGSFEVPITVSNPIIADVAPILGTTTLSSSNNAAVVLDTPGVHTNETLTLTLTKPTTPNWTGTGAGSVTYATTDTGSYETIPIAITPSAGNYAYGLTITDASSNVIATVPAVRFNKQWDWDTTDGNLHANVDGNNPPYPYWTPSATIEGTGGTPYNGTGSPPNLLLSSDTHSHNMVADANFSFTNYRDPMTGLVQGTFVCAQPVGTSSPPFAPLTLTTPPTPPTKIGLWVQGDGKNSTFGFRYRDAQSSYSTASSVEYFDGNYMRDSLTGRSIDWKEWRWITYDPSQLTYIYGGTTPVHSTPVSPIALEWIGIGRGSEYAYSSDIRFDDYTFLTAP